MKKLLLLAIIALSVSAFGQTKTPAKVTSASKEMTVKEYFLAIPTEYLKSDAKKRAAWVESESNEDGNLSFNIPIKEITGEDGEGKVFGGVQVFKKKKGGVIIGMSTNMCEDGECMGQVLLLDYSDGKWNDVTSELAPMIDNDEVIKILRKAPAFDKPLKDGDDVPLFIQFGGTDKLIQFSAGGNNGDGGVVAKTFKWNGETFAEFEYAESPE